MVKTNKKQVEEAIRQLNGIRANWLRRPEVTAVDVGYKITKGELTNEVAVRVHVKRKRPVESLSKHEILSDSEQPTRLGNFNVDVIEAEYGPADALPVEADEEALAVEAAVDRKSRVDPLVGGVSVGNPRISAGTLGAIVWDRNDCSVCLLSNWHVLVGSKTAAAGEAIYVVNCSPL